MTAVSILVVGAGFAGGVMARELADAGHRVHVIDKRPHIAGNTYDEYDAHGVLIHRYGVAHFPHQWRTYFRVAFALHRMASLRASGGRRHKGVTYPFPINRDTLNHLYTVMQSGGISQQ
jgi:UDP-galactopyranose mutase